MSYTKLLRQAYTITIQHPLMWLFGIVLLGGFNLSLVNFAALVSGKPWQTWPVPFGFLSNIAPNKFALAALALAVMFLLLHFVKLVFLVLAHDLIHKKHSDERQETEVKCALCLHQKNHDLQFVLWWLRIMAASIIAIVITAGVSMVVNALLHQAQSGPAAIVINLLFLILVTSVIGTWNAFTAYFIVLHDLKFNQAISAAFDLLVMQFRRVLEFVVLLSAIYTVAVFIGNAFINAYQHGFENSVFMTIRFVFFLAFVLWFAINNTFFNLSFLLFFDSLVKSTPAKQPVDHRVALPQAS